MTIAETAGSDAAGTIESSLHGFLEERLGSHAFDITDLRPIGVGRSRDNWLFDLRRHGCPASQAPEPLILRCDPAGGLVETSRSAEYGLLRALEGASIPSPQARWLDADGHWFGRPAMVMHRLEGSCDYRVVNGERPLARRRLLAQSFCDLLAQVHAVDWSALGVGDVLEQPDRPAAVAEVDSWEAIRRENQLEPWPELDLAAERLRSHAPQSSRTVLVHADYKPGNILLVGDQITGLLDWELAHLGDPLEDLGWVTQPLRTAEHLITGAWEQDDLVARYTEISGHSVDPTALTWWQTFSTFKTVVMQLTGLRAFVEGRSDQPYRPTRRVLGTLIDALEGWT